MDAMNLTQTPEDQYIKVGQIKTRYWTLGDNGSVAILLHGGGSTVEIWTYNISVLARYHRVYAIDMVGAGLTDKPQVAYSLTYQAQFLKEFMDALGIDRASLIGSSMGGGTALQFSLLFPERVEKLVLVNSFGLGKEIAIALRLLALPFVGRLSLPTRQGAALVLKHNVYDRSVIPDEWIELSYQKYGLPGTKRAILNLIETNLNPFGVRKTVFSPLADRLPSIAQPALVIWGQHDRILPVAHAHIAAKSLPNARLHIFNPCGHWPHVERPEEFNTLVLEFLAS
jgi:4,5:9,10-diseco-3-hydroxy-5,9,17-trioxoandrosta-1(10),2-diene-4-oate hydrolase